MCVDSTCLVTASYNFINEARPMYCKVHSKAGMICFNRIKIHSICEHPQCPRKKTHNTKGSKAKYCRRHATGDMINVYQYICSGYGCCKIANFNFHGEPIPTRCKKHIDDGMVNIISRRCRECEKMPAFNFHGETAQYCKTHMKHGMVNVTRPMCIEPGCPKVAHFNTDHDIIPRYCKNHAQQGMVNIFGLKCNQCDRQPAFNFVGEKTPVSCKTHAEYGMVNIKKRTCKHNLCNRTAYFNFKNKKPLFCSRHMEMGMIDVANKKCELCISDDSKKRASYGLPGKPATACSEHKQPGHIANPKRRCEQCKEFAIYGMGTVPKFCEQHKSDHHLNLVHQLCTVCNVLEITDLQGKCSRCSDYLKKRLYCRKQRLVKDWIDRTINLQRYESYDKQIDNGSCGKERPDFMWDAGTHKVILEVDEDQHKDRPCECEQTRMVNITNAIGLPCVWIRFNPDEYKGSKGVTDAKRKDTLIRVLNEYLTTPPQSHQEYCRIIHLFFDVFKLGEAIVPELLPIV